MKIIIWGITLFLAGVISIVLLLAGSIASDWISNGLPSAIGNIFRYGLLPALYIVLELPPLN